MVSTSSRQSLDKLWSPETMLCFCTLSDGNYMPQVRRGPDTQEGGVNSQQQRAAVHAALHIWQETVGCQLWQGASESPASCCRRRQPGQPQRHAPATGTQVFHCLSHCLTLTCAGPQVSHRLSHRVTLIGTVTQVPNCFSLLTFEGQQSQTARQSC